MLYLLERARAAGMSEAFLEVRPSNVAAARLYHSLGFEQVGIRRGYYQASVGREDAAVLRRGCVGHEVGGGVARQCVENVAGSSQHATPIYMRCLINNNC